MSGVVVYIVTRGRIKGGEGGGVMDRFLRGRCREREGQARETERGRGRKHKRQRERKGESKRERRRESEKETKGSKIQSDENRNSAIYLSMTCSGGQLDVDIHVPRTDRAA